MSISTPLKTVIVCGKCSSPPVCANILFRDIYVCVLEQRPHAPEQCCKCFHAVAMLFVQRFHNDVPGTVVDDDGTDSDVPECALRKDEKHHQRCVQYPALEDSQRRLQHH